MKPALLNLGILIFMGVLSGCSKPTSTHASSVAPAAHHKDQTYIQTTTVTQASQEYLGSWFAEVKLISGSTRTLGPPVEGRLTQWLVKPGQTLLPNTPIATLISEEISDLDLTYQELRRQIQLQEELLTSKKAQLNAGVATQHDVQELQTSLEMNRARAKTLQRQRSVRMSSLTKTTNNQIIWESSTSGEITRLSCTEGDRIPTGSQCLTLINKDHPEIIVYIPQKDLAAINQVTNATFTSESGLDSFTVSFDRYDPVVDEDHRMIRSYWTIPHDKATSHTLLSNMTGRLQLNQKASLDTLTLPRLALTQLDGKDVVFKKDSKGWTPVRVNVLREVNHEVLVQSKDLNPEDKIVSQGVFAVKGQYLMGSEGGE